MNDVKKDWRLPFDKMGKRCSRVFLNRYFMLFLFCAATLITVQGYEVGGAVAFAVVICLGLVLCDDIMAIALPLLLMCAFLTKCYDSSATFMKFIWFVIPAVSAFVFHFVVYKGRFTVGKSVWGLLAVSVALTVGGIGCISAGEYFSGSALYHTFFLGFVMILMYLMVKSQLSRKRDYDITEMFIKLLYITGLFACVMVAVHALPLTQFRGGLKLTNDFQPSNNLSTLLMFALPCPFFFVPKSRWHLISPCIMLAAMIFSGSRSGLLLGVVEFVICIIVSAVWDKPRRFFYVCALVGIIAVGIAMRGRIFNVLDSMGLYPFVKEDETRVRLIDRAFELFKKYPVFGHGLGFKGNYDIYSPKTGALGWYHMMIPQIIGSLGAVGIVAYLYQAVMHVWIGARAIRRSSAQARGAVITLLLSYLGVLMMSQVNPGLFCPLPYGLMGMAIFAAIDGEENLLGLMDHVTFLSRKKSNQKKAKL